MAKLPTRISRRFAYALAAASAIAATARPSAAVLKDSRVVYHLCDLDKVQFALTCIHNHFAGVGAEAVTIVLLVHGPALDAFRHDRADIAVADRLASLVDLDLCPQACINTLKAEGIAVDALLPGFTVAERGGVVRLAELQKEGFAYIRP